MGYSTLILFTIATSITPGPNNILILASGVNHGIKKSLLHFLGIVIGFPIMIIAVGLGAGTIFKQFPVLHIGLKIIGIVYLLYLAYKVATSPTNKMEVENEKPFTFIQAALFQWVNPKAWVMAISAVVTFTSVSGSYLLDVLTIAASFLIFSPPCIASWLLFGASLKGMLSNPKRLHLFNIVMSALLVMSLIPIIQELWLSYTA